MNDESAARALLERASHLPGTPPTPPVAQIAARGRRRRRRQRMLPAAAAALVTAVVIALPLIFTGGGRSIPAGPLLPTVTPSPSAVSADATTAQLAQDHWSELPAAPIDARSRAASVWTGSQLLIWGGQSAGGEAARADGAAYEPAAKQWSRLPTSPLSARLPGAWAWTGDAMFVWGGQSALTSGSPSFSDGALYFPATKAWRPLPRISVAGYQWAFAIWTGSQVVLLTAATFDRPGSGIVHAHAFDPAANRWTELPDLAMPDGHTPEAFQVLNSGGAIYLWSLWAEYISLSATSSEIKSGIDGATLDLHSGKWSSNQLGSPLLSGIGVTLWTGGRILATKSAIWCGGGCSPPAYDGPPGAVLDPTHVTATAIPQTPIGRPLTTYVWTGRALLGVGAMNGSPAAAAWAPGDAKWTSVAAPPIDFPGGVAVWTGHELLLWGATDSHGHVAGLRLGP